MSLSDDDFERLVRDIIAAISAWGDQALLLSRWRALDWEIWAVWLPGGRAARVVYAPARAQIVTVLPHDHRFGDSM